MCPGRIVRRLGNVGGMNDLRDYGWLCQRIGLARGTVRSMVSRNQIPHHRLGRRIVRFDPEEIERWLAARRVRALKDDRR